MNRFCYDQFTKQPEFTTSRDGIMGVRSRVMSTSVWYLLPASASYIIHLVYHLFVIQAPWMMGSRLTIYPYVP